MNGKKKSFDRFRIGIVIVLSCYLIAVISFFFYINYFLIAPVEEIDGRLVYNNISYAECIYCHTSSYKSEKNLGRVNNTTSYVYTVKNDSNNDFLTLEGMRLHRVYVKEEIYEKHMEKHTS